MRINLFQERLQSVASVKIRAVDHLVMSQSSVGFANEVQLSSVSEFWKDWMTVDFDQKRKDFEGTACSALEEQRCCSFGFSTRAFVVCQIFLHYAKVHGSSSLHFTAADYSKLNYTTGSTPSSRLIPPNATVIWPECWYCDAALFTIPLHPQYFRHL